MKIKRESEGENEWVWCSTYLVLYFFFFFFYFAKGKMLAILDHLSIMIIALILGELFLIFPFTFSSDIKRRALEAFWATWFWRDEAHKALLLWQFKQRVMASRGGPQRPNGASQGKICQFKLVLLGESAVGKSSLVLRFVKGQFHEYQESTIGGEQVLNFSMFSSFCYN